MSSIPPNLAGNTAPLDKAQQMHVKIMQLQEALTTQNPGIAGLLREIHRELFKDEELTYLLQPEQIAVIVQACEKETQTKIVTDIVKGTKGKSAKNITLEDL